MKKVKLIFGLLMLAVFSLSFVMDNSNNADNDKQAVEKARVKPPRNG
jgi:hypothetical protein